MSLVGKLKLLFESLFEDVLTRIDPEGRLRLSSVRVVPSTTLVREALLEGINAVCFTLGNPPEVIIAFSFEGSSKVWEDLIKGGIGSDLLHSSDPTAFLSSLLKETGNIIVGPLSTRFSRALGREVLPSVPFTLNGVDNLEKLLQIMGEGPLPVFRGRISDGHVGSIQVYVIPSRRFLSELNERPEIVERARGHPRGRGLGRRGGIEIA
ncbi:hypothetical protein A3L09_04520 [Thermococcus profundus]|uniref:Chemotaxis protein CheC n=1 Tax=Thermococcus profundus TaxID=49899 RepID=A0A2Z2MAU5_THEPR|nr:chemotaxis protein CheC [Thermococcus profundus]ASJ02573.1 hypothetical protein A3L09_04520 [Thermococcus profundus]